VCPLNWGLGHASRMILVIQELLNQNIEVIIAADSTPLALLKEEFPTLKAIVLKDVEVRYSRKNQQILKIIGFLPQLAYRIYKENKDLTQIIASENINIVISDNRYGLWNKQIYSVFVSHQLRLKMPLNFVFLEVFTQKLIQFLTRKFDEIWIPDFENETNFSGTLSHLKQYNKNKTHFVGILSKFLMSEFQTQKKQLFESERILAILSGPEPQRTILEELLLNQLNVHKLKATLVLGKEKDTAQIKHQNIEIVNFANRTKLFELISKAEIIVCRAGYSSIMDLAALQKTAILIATPGQTEQEYLADYLSRKKLFVKAQQASLNLKTSILELKKLDTTFEIINNNLLIEAIQRMLTRLQKNTKTN